MKKVPLGSMKVSVSCDRKCRVWFNKDAQRLLAVAGIEGWIGFRGDSTNNAIILCPGHVHTLYRNELRCHHNSPRLQLPARFLKDLGIPRDTLKNQDLWLILEQTEHWGTCLYLQLS